MVLVYEDDDLRIDRYTDSKFQSDVDDKKFISRFIVTIN